ncbi:MAG: PAS domain-containing protein, partial [Fibrobacterales bacterium]
MLYQKRRTYRVILICVTLVFSALVTVIAWAIEEQESWSRVRSVEIANQKEYLLIKNDIDERIKVLQRIAFRWGIVKGTTKETFAHDAQNYEHDYPGYQAIEWVDSSYTVQWVIPLLGNEAAQGLNLAFEENRINALNKARNKRAPTVSSPITLVQGGQGFLVYNPLYVNEIFDGFVLAVFNTQEWLEQLLGELEFHGIQKEYISQVFMNNERIFSDIGWSALQDSSYDVTTSFQSYGTKFSIITRPTKQFLRESHTMFPELVFVVGMVISLLLSVVIYLYQKAVEVKNKSTRYNELLQVEVAEHLSTEETLAKERQRLAYILEGTNVGTWEWNVQTGETVLNERWAGIIGYTLEELSPVNIDNWMKFAHPDDLKISEEILKKNFRRELDFYDCELRMRHKNGHWVWMFGRGKVFTWTEEGKPLLMCGTHQEITQRKEYEQKIQYMATHDSLTHVPNLNVAQDRLTMALESAKRNKKLVGVLFVDMDGFKNIND